MQYGHFDDENKEYVITRPDTPRSWSNYLGSTEYGAIITNNAGGYSFFRSAAQGRFTRLRFNSVPTDQPGRYFYLRDNADGDFWSASWQPVGKPLDAFKSTTRHGTAYTVIESEYADIATEATYFVPLGQHFEYWRLKITNNDSVPRDLSLFTYVEFANNWTVIQDLINLQFSQYIVKTDVFDNIIQCAVLDNVPADESDFQNNDQGRWSWMSLSGAAVSGFETSREKFIGDYRTYANPTAVERGQCANSLAHGDNACGSFQANIVLQPGETREIVVMLGIGKAEIGRATTIEYSKSSRVEEELQKLKDSWHAKLGRLTVKTPDADFDHMINVWNAYNCLITFAWSRSASLVYNGERDGLGFRDTVQDILGVLPALQDEARNRLELMLTGQLANGGAMPVVKPFAHAPGHECEPPLEEYRSDDSLWLFNTVPAYVAETGELDFYHKVLPFADNGEASVLGHLRRAIEFNLERSGAHGLPCGLSADWNDCLQLGYKGESVFVAFQLRLALKVYGEVSALLGCEDEELWAHEQQRVLDAAIQTHAWDGEWFVRAFREDGFVFGDKASAEGQIFLNSQVWSVISGAASREQATSALDAVHEKLSTEYGLMLCAPPYEKIDYHVMRAVLFNTGQKENGGIFCHPQGWAVIAEAMNGNGNRAYEYYRAYMPSAYNDRAEVRQSEPYVHAQSTHASSSRQFGASRLPWLSGTAAWSYYAATNYILGFQPQHDGVTINPCIPSHWNEYSMSRLWRGKTLNIRVTNLNGAQCGVQRLTLNGASQSDNFIAFENLLDENKVEVEM